MVKVTFEGDSLSEIRDNIKEFFSTVGELSEAGGEEAASGESKAAPRTRNRSGGGAKKEEAPAKVTHETLRKWISDNEDKKSDCRELINDMGFDAVAEIPDEKLEKVLTKFKAL